MRVVLTGESTAFSKCRKWTTECVQRDWKFCHATPRRNCCEQWTGLTYFCLQQFKLWYRPWLACDRCIICPINAEVDRINDVIMRCFPGEEKNNPKQRFYRREWAPVSHLVYCFTVPLRYATSKTNLEKKIALSCCYGTWTPLRVTTMEPGTSSST